jgi:membrane protein
MKRVLKLLIRPLYRGFWMLGKSNPMILASSTAFFATFSLPPSVILLITFLGWCFDDHHLGVALFEKIEDILGHEATEQIQTIAANFVKMEEDGLVGVGVFLFFVFAATTLLVIIQDSLHILWRINLSATNKLRKTLLGRAKAFSLILSIGVLFLLSLAADASLLMLKEHLPSYFHSHHILTIRAMHVVLAFVIITLWFMLVYKVLPDARVTWQVAFAGGMLSSLLFNVGKVVLGRFLVHSKIAVIFGTSGSFALILLFIFYTSFIFYFGAAVTFAFGRMIKQPISPSDWNVKTEPKQA